MFSRLKLRNLFPQRIVSRSYHQWYSIPLEKNILCELCQKNIKKYEILESQKYKGVDKIDEEDWINKYCSPTGRVHRPVDLPRNDP